MAAVLLCLAAGGPGIADRLSAWTGIHGSGVGEEDTSEYLLSTAPDFRRAVESLRPAHLGPPAGRSGPGAVPSGWPPTTASCSPWSPGGERRPDVRALGDTVC
jgi:hypothetical protein